MRKRQKITDVFARVIFENIFHPTNILAFHVEVLLKLLKFPFSERPLAVVNLNQ